MEKSKVKKIESQARKLMKLDNSIWNKYKWESEDQVDQEIYQAELKKKIRPRSLSYVYYHIFEDANYHSLNKALEEIGAFYGTYGDAQEEFTDYHNSGGKTWQL